MITDWTRALTLNERLYGIGEELNPPFAMQFVLEGNALIEPTAFQLAIDRLSAFYPVLFLQPNHQKWTLNGIKPTVCVHKKACPSNLSDSFFRDKLKAENGQCIEFHLFQTDRTTIVFRILHRIMDGIGALKLIEALFSILKGQTPIGVTIHPSEAHLKNKIEVKPKKNSGGFANKWKGLTPNTGVKINDFNSELIRFTTKVKDGIGKIAAWYMAENQAPAQFLIPVNCRRHGVYTKALSNLSLPIYLKTNPQQSPLEIQAQLLSKMAANQELGDDPLEKWARIIPTALLRKIIQTKANSSFKSNKYAMSAYISDLGFVDLESMSFDGFKALDFYSIPVYTATIPICFLMLHHQQGTRICFSASTKYRIDELRAGLEAILQPVAKTVDVIETEVNRSPLEVAVSEVWAKFMGIELEPNIFSVSFSDLGGESLSLLFIVEELGGKYCPSHQGQFLTEVLKLASAISIRKMALILHQINPNL